MGQFVPGIDTLARFHIEGVQGGVTTYSDEKKAAEDNTYYCDICHKYMKVEREAQSLSAVDVTWKP